MLSHHALEQLRPGHAESSIMRTRRHTGGPRRRQVTDRIAKIAIGGLKLTNEVSSPKVLRVGHRNSISVVGDHEDAPVRTVFGAQAAPDAVILDDNLKVIASMNGVDRTSDHAMWIRAGPTGGSDQEIIQSLSGPEQAWNRNTMCLRPVLLDTAPGAGVATRAVIEVEHKDALTFIEPLFDILVEDSVTHRRTV